MKEEKLGVIAHYFNHIGVGIIKIEQGTLQIGDTIRIKGNTTDLTQTVDSMQIEHLIVQQSAAGTQVGVKLQGPVRQNDTVFKVIA